MRCRTVLRDGASLRPLTLAAAVCTLLVTLLVPGVHTAHAGACGDNVDGERVACACGDHVVTDTVLWPTDPVATEPCSGDGLTLVAESDDESLTLHLGGQSIVGTGRGTGIRVAAGGRLGAVIVGGDADDSRAEIANFGTGIRASGRDVLQQVRSIDIHDNEANGLSIHASGVRLEDVKSDTNGGSGLSLSGHGNEVSGLSAHGNAGDGLKVRGSAATLDAVTTGNGQSGAAIGGRGNRVEELHTRDNGGAGVVATGNGHDVSGVRASGNSGGTISAREGATE